MARLDRFPQENQLELATHAQPEKSQGELFARLALRPLPVMKGTPEDFWIFTAPTIH